MEELKLYKLPELPYGYNALAPFMSEVQLRLHHQKHHQAYVNNINAAIQKISKARKEFADFDVKTAAKDLSFNFSGNSLHSLFWKNMKPPGGASEPKGDLLQAIIKEFSSLERFKKEFGQAAISVEGSGWAAAAFCPEAERLYIVQIEKHNVNLFANLLFLMVLDVWEHAYYVDYRNDRVKYVEGFWTAVNWDYVEERFSAVKNIS